MEEVVVAILSAVGEVLLELVLNIVFPAIVEAIVEGLFYRRSRTGVVPESNRSREWRSRIVACTSILLFAIVGSVAGWLSLIAYPELLIGSPKARVVNLVLTPTIVGLLLHRRRETLLVQHEQAPRQTSFLHGFVLALCFVLVRYSKTFKR